MSRKLQFVVVALGLLVALPVMAQSPTEQTPSDQPSQVEPLQQQEPLEPAENQEPVAGSDEQAGEPAGTETGAKNQPSSVESSGDEAGTADEERMPKTASPLALLALLGGAGVGSAFGLRRLRRR